MRESIMKSEADKSNEWQRALLAKIRKQEQEDNQVSKGQKDSNLFHFLKTCNLIFGTLLLS